MKNKEKKIVYAEPDDYFPKEIREKYKLGEFAEPDMAKQKGITVEQAGEIKQGNGKEITNLELIRRRRNLSQSKLASISGVSLKAIQSFEQKYRDINGTHLNNLINLCFALDCGLVDILEGDEIKSKLQELLDRTS